MAATTDSELHQLVAGFGWQVFSETPQRHVHPLFGRAFPSQDAYNDLIFSAPLRFAPGLLDVVLSESPPDVQYFKTLPAETYKQWAVYLLVLEKFGQRPGVYIGSGTQKLSGVLVRLNQYDTINKLPFRVDEALRNGFTITHKALLCQMPIPIPSQIPILRIVTMALEAMFTFKFSTIVPSYKLKSDTRQLCI
jgi:hypothetical protein